MATTAELTKAMAEVEKRLLKLEAENIELRARLDARSKPREAKEPSPKAAMFPIRNYLQRNAKVAPKDHKLYNKYFWVTDDGALMWRYNGEPQDALRPVDQVTIDYIKAKLA